MISNISNKCKGLPLALKTMGGLMSSKQEVQEWEAIADCNISDTSKGKGEVLSILKLSYNHLPPEMKQCFAFCAVFPKDYELEKDMLIQLWIANGYIHEKGTMDLAQKGEFVFNELAWRSFLEDVISVRRNYVCFDYPSKWEPNCCIMHDLMHDLAKTIANECAIAEELIQQKVSINGVHHLHILGSHLWDEINQLFRDNIYLRTLLIDAPSFWDQDLVKSRLMSSRALRFYFTDTSIFHRQSSHAAHLRYLDLSGSPIDSLPNSVCMLCNLYSLRLNNCSLLQYLPEGLRTMQKLSHIYLLGCYSLKRMPPKLSQLHNLRTLTTFVVDTEDGCGIEELEGLQHLGNRLELYNLKKVKCVSKVNLHEKQNLNELLLFWGRTSKPDDKPMIDDANNHEQVLESLVPYGELKSLEVHGYGGLTISQWMRNPQMFRCLRELTMRNCPWCKDLPIVWLSSSLEHLSLSFMECLTTLYKNIDMEAGVCNTSLQIFPKLKRMVLIHLPELEIKSSLIFPCLEMLEISGCDRLASLPETPILTYLRLVYYGKKGCLSMCKPLGCFSSLVCLHIARLLVDVVVPPDDQQSQSQRPLDTLRYLRLEGDDSFISTFNKSKLKLGLQRCFVLVEELDILSCSNIVSWPVEELRCFPRLRSLRMGYCSEGNGSSCEEEKILPLPQLERFEIQDCDSLLQIPKLPSSLQIIFIHGSRSLVALPSNLGDLAKLRKLLVFNCGALKALPDGMDGLTSLEWLEIVACPGIEIFPRGFLQRLPALKSLRIDGCPDLQRRCREGGEYFDLVASIPYKHIEAPAPERKKAVKWLLPSCVGGSQGN